jgi:hypothetical protein
VTERPQRLHANIEILKPRARRRRSRPPIWSERLHTRPPGVRSRLATRTRLTPSCDAVADKVRRRGAEHIGLDPEELEAVKNGQESTRDGNIEQASRVGRWCCLLGRWCCLLGRMVFSSLDRMGSFSESERPEQEQEVESERDHQRENGHSIPVIESRRCTANVSNGF